jgi:hypothetical protein
MWRAPLSANYSECSRGFLYAGRALMSKIFEMSNLMTIMRLPFVFVAVSALLSFISPVFAQTPSPQARPTIIVSGTVRDSAGTPIADASVLFEETATAASSDAKTGPDGTYSFLALRAGTYVVRVRKEKFRDATSGALELSLGQRKQVDLVLTSPKPSANMKKPSN